MTFEESLEIYLKKRFKYWYMHLNFFIQILFIRITVVHEEMLGKSLYFIAFPVVPFTAQKPGLIPNNFWLIRYNKIFHVKEGKIETSKSKKN